MIHKMTHAMVAHTWANPRNDSDYAYATNNRMYFDGDTIYSYGSHFPIARHVAGAVLFTTLYTASGAHKDLVRHAIVTGTVVFHVPYVQAETKSAHLSNLKDFKKHIENHYLKADRCRVDWYRDWELRQAASLIDQFNAYSKLFKLRLRFKEPKNMKAMIDGLKHAEREACERKRQKQAKYAEAWRRGEYHGNLYDLDVMLRVTGEEVVTSLGARFSVGDAKRVFPLIKRCRKHKKAWQANGAKVYLGYFVIDKITNRGHVRSACHFVKWPEIERCAQELGLAA